MMRPSVRHAALASCAGFALAACATSPPNQITGAATAKPVPSQHASAAAACPAGRLQPGREVVYIEWVDFLQFNGRQYDAGLGPAVTIHPSQLGPVITHIRCSLAARDDHRHLGYPLTNNSAAFLPAGAAVFQVRGYPPGCRLAGYVGGQLHVYLAQHDVHGQSAPLRCAL